MTEEERQYREYMLRKKRRAKARRKRVIRQRIMAGSVLLLVIIFIVVALAVRAWQRQAQETAANVQAEMEAMEEAKRQAEEEKENNTLHLLAVGDNFYHDAILQDNIDASGQWDFHSIYEKVKPVIAEADLAVVNQEVPLISDGENASGYPKFGTPFAGGEALADTGFDIVTMATNHSYDKGDTGITDSLQFWRENHPEMAILGIHDSVADQEENRVQIVKKKNFTLAMMNYTCLINEDAQVPEDRSYSVDVYEEQTVQSDLEKAGTLSDFVIVFLHTGTENDSEVDSRTEERIDFLAEHGADLIVCTHPHVLRKTEMLTRADGGQTLVYYSLGNFVSAQKEVPQLLEGMADVTLTKDKESGKVSVSEYSLIPLVMHYGKDQTECEVYLFSDYTENLAHIHGVHEYSEESFTMESVQAYFQRFSVGTD